jgi:hypothetical protein
MKVYGRVVEGKAYLVAGGLEYPMSLMRPDLTVVQAVEVLQRMGETTEKIAERNVRRGRYVRRFSK